MAWEDQNKGGSGRAGGGASAGPCWEDQIRSNLAPPSRRHSEDRIVRIVEDSEENCPDAGGGSIACRLFSKPSVAASVSGASHRTSQSSGAANRSSCGSPVGTGTPFSVWTKAVNSPRRGFAGLAADIGRAMSPWGAIGRVATPWTPPWTPTHSVKVMNQATFIQDPTLLRGAPTHYVLSGFGGLFASSEGRSSHFELSQPVPSIDYFLSHNWVTGRWSKFFALAIRFNLMPAVYAAWIVGFVVALLTALERIDDFSVYVDNHGVRRSFNAWIFGQAAFVAVLLFWQEMKCLAGRCNLLPRCCGTSVFLDKVCIHQTDKELQSQGIASLAGFLRASRRMVVVYSDVYLRRLWTVYEVASFLTLNEDLSCIVLTPTKWTGYFAFMMLALVANHVFYHLGHWAAEQPGSGLHTAWIAPAALLNVNVVFCFVMRNWLRCVHDMSEHIGTFSIRQAKCAVEADRALVQGNICAFMKHLGRTPISAGKNEALDAFDGLVREKLHTSLATSLGRHTFPYWFITAACMAYVLDAVDVTASLYLAGACWPKLLAGFCGSAVNCFAPCQFGIACCTVVVRRRMDLRGLRETLFLALALLAFLLPIALIYVPVLVLYKAAMLAEDEEALVPALLCVAYCLLFVALSAWLFRPVRIARDEGAELKSSQDGAAAHVFFSDIESSKKDDASSIREETGSVVVPSPVPTPPCLDIEEYQRNIKVDLI